MDRETPSLDRAAKGLISLQALKQLQTGNLSFTCRNKAMFFILPKRVYLYLKLIIASLILSNFIVQTAKYFLWKQGTSLALLDKVAKILNVDREYNLPSFYSSLALFLSAVLIGLIASVKQKQSDRLTLHWQALSFIFLCLSLDEWFAVHDRLDAWLHSRVQPQGVISHLWIFPAIAVITLFGLSYRKFVFSLPKETKLQFIWAAVIYVFGAVGVETIHDLIGGGFMEYLITVSIEEACEMFGVAMFIHALLLYMAKDIKQLQITFTQDLATPALPISQELVEK